MQFRCLLQRGSGNVDFAGSRAYQRLASQREIESLTVAQTPVQRHGMQRRGVRLARIEGQIVTHFRVVEIKPRRQLRRCRRPDACDHLFPPPQTFRLKRTVQGKASRRPRPAPPADRHRRAGPAAHASAARRLSRSGMYCSRRACVVVVQRSCRERSNVASSASAWARTAPSVSPAGANCSSASHRPVSSSRYRGSPRASATTRDLSTRLPRISRMPDGQRPVSATCCAASRPKLPTKTPSRRNTAISEAVSKGRNSI